MSEVPKIQFHADFSGQPVRAGQSECPENALANMNHEGRIIARLTQRWIEMESSQSTELKI